MATREGFYFGQVDAKAPTAAYIASVSPTATQPAGADIKLGASGVKADEAYLASIGESPLAKAEATIDAFANALATIADLTKRLDALIERDAEAATATARSSKEVGQ